METKKAPRDPVIKSETANDINAALKPLDLNSGLLKQMKDRSLLSMGNTQRLEGALKKLSSGEDTLIAFIGGSITQGAGAEPAVKECYARKTFEGIGKLFTNRQNLRFCKAGIGGTPSLFAAFRFERDILRAGLPDILVIEFAVNDDIDETKGEAYESLIRRALSLPSKPAVILLFAVFKDGFNLQEQYSKIGKHYGLPMVSIKDAIFPQFDDPEACFISKERFFFDDYHPTSDGHTIMAGCLLNLFEKLKEGKTGRSEDTPDPAKEPLLSKAFQKGYLIDRKTVSSEILIRPGAFIRTDTDLQTTEFDASSRQLPVMPDNFSFDPEADYEDFYMEITCSVLAVMYKDTPDESFTPAEVFVDGTFVRILDPHENDWTHCNTKLLLKESTPKKHTLRIGIPEDKRALNFTILGFGAG